jgi:putative aldouronate transport system substrate-binding protein
MLLVLAFAFALFAGCGNKAENNGGSSAAAAGNDTAQNAGTETDAAESTPAAEEESPYNFATGVELNADGYPVSKYVYELPLSTTDEKFTMWTTCYSPELIPEEGFGSLPMQAGVREMTGVNIEYNVVSAATRQENFAVNLNSDSLDDIIIQGGFFYTTGTLRQAVDDGYFANLIDYKDYMPCYLYENYAASKTNPDILNYIYYDAETMPVIYGRYKEVNPNMGFYLRQDWLDKLGLGLAEDVKTYEQLTDIMAAFKTEQPEAYPMFMFSAIELDSYMFTGYNTYIVGTGLSNKRVVDGKVQFCGTTDDCGLAMAQLADWYAKEYVNPNYLSAVAGQSYNDGTEDNTTGVFPCLASTIGAESSNPDAVWAPMPKPLLTEDQVIHFGQSDLGFHYGSTAISAKCANIPLVVTWVDWWFSDEGSDFTNWGPEGFIWEYNDKGERELTDFILTQQVGTAVAMSVYLCSFLADACLFDNNRHYAYPGGEAITKSFEVWKIKNYDGAYAFPASIKLSAEDGEAAATIMQDLNTYFAEQIYLFVDGSRPINEWDAFQTELDAFGLSDVTAIWQAQYDTYLADNA